MPLPPAKDKLEGAIVSTPERMKRKPDDVDQEYDVMHSAAEDLIKAVHSRDVTGVAEALKAAFELADSEPHEEGPHYGDE